MKIKTFCPCSLFPSWSVQGLISNSVYGIRRRHADNQRRLFVTNPTVRILLPAVCILVFLTSTLHDVHSACRTQLIHLTPEHRRPIAYKSPTHRYTYPSPRQHKRHTCISPPPFPKSPSPYHRTLVFE